MLSTRNKIYFEISLKLYNLRTLDLNAIRNLKETFVKKYNNETLIQALQVNIFLLVRDGLLFNDNGNAKAE